MNKQELIDKLKRHFTVMSEIKGSEYDKGYNWATKQHLVMIADLDEPEKPVVPQFVADFYESIKDDFEDKLYDLCVQHDNDSDELSREVWDWLVCIANKPIETLVKMKLYGYEVEKEKLYIAKNKITNSYLGKNGGWSHYGRACSPEIIKHSKSTWRSLGVWDNDLYEITEVKDD